MLPLRTFFLLTVVSVSILMFCPSVFAAEVSGEVKSEELQNLSTIGVIDLAVGTKTEELAGKIVKLRFTAKVDLAKSDDKGNWTGTLVEASSHKGTSGRVEVAFPTESAAESWYKRLPFNQEGPSKTVIVRVIGREGDLIRVRALGREVRNATTKPEFIW